MNIQLEATYQKSTENLGYALNALFDLLKFIFVPSKDEYFFQKINYHFSFFAQRNPCFPFSKVLEINVMASLESRRMNDFMKILLMRAKRNIKL